MDLQVAEALEEVRPAVAFEPDWDDVLRRGGVSGRPARARGRRSVPLALLAAVAVTIAVAPAFGLRGKVASLFAVAKSPHPAASWSVVGRPVPATPAIAAAARLTHVHRATLRQVAAGGSGYRRVVLLGGIGPDGRPWLAQSGPGWTSDFFPLFGPVGDVDRHVWHTRTPHGWDGWQFPMFGRADSRRAVYTYAAFGGSRPGSITWATLVGFVRGDVARVVVVGADGSRHATALGRSRGYSFAAADAAALPRLVIALDASGHELAREPIRLQSLSP
jgi:hypothetical protein